ncbi:hypothetical protein Tco_0563160, partial [Tanacetum coccineum]
VEGWFPYSPADSEARLLMASAVATVTSAC